MKALGFHQSLKTQDGRSVVLALDFAENNTTWAADSPKKTQEGIKSAMSLGSC
jgi:hypothetical protein